MTRLAHIHILRSSEVRLGIFRNFAQVYGVLLFHINHVGSGQLGGEPHWYKMITFERMIGLQTVISTFLWMDTN